MKTSHPFSARQESISHPRYAHALVIGGSMAGLLAAWVLADHVEQVTIIERDQLPQEPALRPGVPQMRHGHVLLARGQQILETLFPGLGAELAAAGAEPVDWCADVERSGPAGWALRFPSDIQIYSCSRKLLEWCVRRRVAGHPRIHFREACRVTDLVFDEHGRYVTGVRLVPRSASPDEPAATTTVGADLVVDASGRASRAPRWLAAYGYPVPTETVIDSRIGYATRYYEADPSIKWDWKGLGAYTQTQGAGILTIEDGRWSVLLTGMGDDAPPTDEAGFQSFMRNLGPELGEALHHARPVSPIYGYRRTENRWRHYERLVRQPDNFLVLGDAVCSLNPTYGQGMTTAALAAVTLDRCLHRQRAKRHGSQTGFAARFQRQLARSLRVPWVLATSADTKAARAAGDQPILTRLVHAYMDRLYLLTRRNARIALARSRVVHLVRPPISLFYPSIVLPVIAHWLRTRFARLGARHAVQSANGLTTQPQANLLVRAFKRLV